MLRVSPSACGTSPSGPSLLSREPRIQPRPVGNRGDCRWKLGHVRAETCRKQGSLFGLRAEASGERWLPRDRRFRRYVAVRCSSRQELVSEPPTPSSRQSEERIPSPELDCVASGISVECVIHSPETNGACASEAPGTANGGTGEQVEPAGTEQANGDSTNGGLVHQKAPAENGSLASQGGDSGETQIGVLAQIGAAMLLISPFFFWGSSMVAMKDVLPRAGPMFVAAFRLIPAGFLLVGFAAWKGRPMPTSAMAWIAIAAFAVVDAACFQGFLAEGLKRTSAGLGSVIIDSQPLTVAVLAAILFGEHLGPRGVLGLALGIVGLCLLEVPWDSITPFLSFLPLLSSLSLPDSLDSAATLSTAGAVSTVAATVNSSAPGEWSLLESGEWWMLLAAQSMALGTVMVRWVCKHADPIMATGWHLVLGGIPLLALSAVQQDPALQAGGLGALSGVDWALLGYTSLFGSAVSYGVFFYNASRGNLTKLSSLTFLTPAFAALFGYLFLDESLNGQQLFGASVTLLAIYLVNTQQPPEKES